MMVVLTVFGILNNVEGRMSNCDSSKELIYDNVWGGVYNPVASQCDDTPTITADGSNINPDKASSYRWMGISWEMLYDLNRAKAYNKTPDGVWFKGKLGFGDTIWVESPYKEINGWWVIHDLLNKKMVNGVNFLQTTGDKRISGSHGKFDQIKIYKINGCFYKNLAPLISPSTISKEVPKNPVMAEPIKTKPVNKDTVSISVNNQTVNSNSNGSNSFDSIKYLAVYNNKMLSQYELKRNLQAHLDTVNREYWDLFKVVEKKKIELEKLQNEIDYNTNEMNKCYEERRFVIKLIKLLIK